MKAMILAAGRGSRLQPLTDTIPKPLLLVGKKTLIEYNLDLLNHAGIDDVVINVSHHAKQIMDFLGDGSRYGLTIQYSYEPEVLGTGGGIFQALELLGKEPFLLLSADVWTELKFSPALMGGEGEAHLVLVDNPDYHHQGDFALSDNNTVMLSGNKLTYAGIARVHPKLFRDAKPGAFSLAPLLNNAVSRGVVTGERYGGAWFNVGTIKELERLRQLLCQPVANRPDF